MPPRFEVCTAQSKQKGGAAKPRPFGKILETTDGERVVLVVVVRVHVLVVVVQVPVVSVVRIVLRGTPEVRVVANVVEVAVVVTVARGERRKAPAWNAAAA